METNKQIGALIRTMRKSRGMTQAELATAIGKAASAVAMYERGEREPGFETLEALADVFNVPLNSLLPPSYSDLDQINRERLEALHQNPRLGLLFDKATKMSPADVEYMLRFADGILKERDGDD